MRPSLAPARALVALVALLSLLAVPSGAAAAACDTTSTRSTAFRAFAATTGCRPTASFTATPTMVAVGETVTLDASASKAFAPATLTSYQWNYDQDEEFEEITATPVVSHVFPRGKHTVRLRVVDDQDVPMTGSAAVDIVVANLPTVALAVSDAAPDSGESVLLTASASDPDGEPLTYEWDVEGTGDWVPGAPGATTKTVSWPSPGARAPRVRVTDAEFATAEDAVAVDVQNTAPRAALSGPATIQTHTDVTFDASGSLDDSAITAFHWDLDGDGIFERSTAGSSVTQRYTEGRAFTVAVRAEDGAGLTGDATLAVVVTDGPVAQVAASGSPASFGQTVTFDASGSSDPDGGTLTFAWDLDGDNVFEIGPDTVTGSWTTPQNRVVRVRVTDQAGASATASVPLVVRNVLPVIASLTPSTTAPRAGQPLTLQAGGVGDADGTIAELQWDLDGDTIVDRTTAGDVLSATTTYAAPGTVRPRVRVVDNHGGATVRQATIVVGEADGPPSAPVTGPGAGTPGGTPGPGTTTGPPAPGGPVALATPAAGAPGAPQGPQGGAGAPRAADGWRLGVTGLSGAAVQRLTTVRKRGVTVVCHGPAGSRCRVWLELSAKEARRLRLGRKKVRIGSATGVVRADGRVTVKLKLTKRARTRVQKVRRAALTARAELRDSAGRTVRPTRAVLVR